MSKGADAEQETALVKSSDATSPSKTAKRSRRKRNVTELRDLTTYQRNQLFGLLRDNGVNPADFTWNRMDVDYWEEREDGQYFQSGTHSIPALQNRGDADVFLAVGVFPESDSYMRYGFAPARITESVWDETSSWGTFTSAITAEWIPAVKAHLMGDLWEQVEKQRAVLTAAGIPTENTPLTDAEQRRIEASVDDLLARVRDLKLFPREQYERFQSAMRHQKQAAGWLGRVDWLNAFMGAVFSHMLSLMATPQHVQQFLALAAQAVSWLNAHPPQLLAPQP